MNSNNVDERKKTGKLLFEIGIVIMILTLIVGYNLYMSLIHNWKIVSEGNVFFQAFIQSGNHTPISYLTRNSLYIYVLSVFFSFLGNKEELVIIINLILQLIGIIFFYLGNRKLYAHISSIFILLLSGILSICFYPTYVDNPTHVVWCFGGIIFWIFAFLYKDISGIYLKYIPIGIMLGICCYVDLVGFIFTLAIFFIILFVGEISSKVKWKQLLCTCIFVFISYFVMFFLWNGLGFNLHLFQQWVDHMLSAFNTEYNWYPFISIVVLLLTSVFILVYHKSSNKNTKENKKEIPKEVNSKIEEPVETTENKTIKFIENPLPLPKKHVKKEMNYAFEPSKEQMHYDLNNYNVEDDYDLKDI